MELVNVPLDRNYRYNLVLPEFLATLDGANPIPESRFLSSLLSNQCRFAWCKFEVLIRVFSGWDIESIIILFYFILCRMKVYTIDLEVNIFRPESLRRLVPFPTILYIFLMIIMILSQYSKYKCFTMIDKYGL